MSSLYLTGFPTVDSKVCAHCVPDLPKQLSPQICLTGPSIWSSWASQDSVWERAAMSTGLDKGAHSHGDPPGSMSATQISTGSHPRSSWPQAQLLSNCSSAWPSLASMVHGLASASSCLYWKFLCSHFHRGLSLGLSQGKGLTLVVTACYHSLPVSTSHPSSQTGQLLMLITKPESKTFHSRAQSESTRKQNLFLQTLSLWILTIQVLVTWNILMELICRKI